MRFANQVAGLRVTKDISTQERVIAKDIQFDAHGGPEVMEYINFTPSDPGPGEVQVENKAISINYIDIYVCSGLYPTLSLTFSLRPEAAGVVSKPSPVVEHFQPSERVVYAQSPQGSYATVHNVPAPLT